MRRQQIVIPILFFGGLIFLLQSGGVHIRSGISTNTVQQTGALLYQPLTGTLLISPYGSQDELIAALKKAKYSIDIWGYQLSDESILNTLRAKAALGINVRIVLEKYTHGNQQEDFLALYKALSGSLVQIHDDLDLGINYQHAKTFVIDQSSFIVSTANSTYPGFFTNREYWFIGHNPSYAALLTQIFNADRQKKKQHPSLPDNLWVCPFNCRDNLPTFIASATGSILIQAQYLEDKALMNQLEEKIRQGVQVRILVGKHQENNLSPTISHVTHRQEDPNVHAKNILIDGQKLYVGSMNLSANAIDNNREIGVVTSDRFAVKKFLQQFEEDWKSHSK